MGRYQDDFRKMVIARIRAGESRTSIATSLSIPPTTIKNWARNEGLNKTMNKINDKQKLQIFELLENGLTKTKIAEMLGVSRGQVTYATQDREHRSPRYHNLETKHLVLRRIMSGELEKNISEEFGIPIGTIKFWMRGLRKRGLSDEQIQEVRRRVKNGESKSKVARDLRIG